MAAISPYHVSRDGHPQYKGDRAHYVTIHQWVAARKIRTGICEHCKKEAGFGKSGTHFANISGDYKRDISDYVELCISCHRKYDAGLIEL